MIDSPNISVKPHDTIVVVAKKMEKLRRSISRINKRRPNALLDPTHWRFVSMPATPRDWVAFGQLHPLDLSQQIKLMLVSSSGKLQP